MVWPLGPFLYNPYHLAIKRLPAPGPAGFLVSAWLPRVHGLPALPLVHWTLPSPPHCRLQVQNLSLATGLFFCQLRTGLGCFRKTSFAFFTPEKGNVSSHPIHRFKTMPPLPLSMWFLITGKILSWTRGPTYKSNTSQVFFRKQNECITLNPKMSIKPLKSFLLSQL